MVTDQGVDVVNVWRADCPFCGDHSRPVELRGGVSIGATDHVVNVGADAVDGVIHLRTKASKGLVGR